MWAGYIEGMICWNWPGAGHLLQDRDEVMAAQGFTNTLKLGLWVHPYKLLGRVCKALATSDWGRDFLNKHVYNGEFRGLDEGAQATGVSPGSKQGLPAARITDAIASMAGSSEGCIHLRDSVLKVADKSFG